MLEKFLAGSCGSSTSMASTSCGMCPMIRGIASRRSEQLGNGEVVATICAYGDVITLRQDTGAVAGRQQVAARFDETFTQVDGTWKWIHRQKMDAGGDLASDCAVPEP
jgi:hypothetical protein